MSASGIFCFVTYTCSACESRVTLDEEAALGSVDPWLQELFDLRRSFTTTPFLLLSYHQSYSTLILTAIISSTFIISDYTESVGLLSRLDR